MRGVEQTLREQGYSLLLGSANNDHEQERSCLQQMMGQGVDAVSLNRRRAVNTVPIWPATWH